MSKQTEAITNWLKLMLRPGQTTELRALAVGGRRAVSFISSSPVEIAAKAAEWDREGAKGCYFTPNPVRPDLAGATCAVRKADIARRNWLLIDVDPVRAPGHENDPSSDAEKEAAWKVLDACRGTMDAAGLAGAVVADSGNGWHLAYPLDLPNDDQSQDLIKRILVGLNKLCGRGMAKVDTSTHDAPRIWKLYGTTSRKGTNSPERPHRLSWLVSGQPWALDVAQANSDKLTRILERWQFVFDVRARRPRTSAEGYAQAALDSEERLVAESQPGNRNQQLFKSAANVFELVAGGCLDGELAANVLGRAARRAGLEDDEIQRTLQSARETAKANPRSGPQSNGCHSGSGDAPQDSYSVPSYIGREPNTKKSRGDARTPPKTPGSAFPPPVPASHLQHLETAKWLWRGYIARGSVTLFSALWKSGKTTLLSHLLKASAQGGEFCGQELDPCQVLYVTEESESRWAGRRDALELQDNVDFLLRPFKSGKPDIKVWTQFMHYLAFLQPSRKYDLIIFDTLSDLWPVRDENDAGGVMQALKPLHLAMGSAALLLVHHNRKGDGSEATATRGSGALPGWVDTILEFRRYSPEDKEDRRRVLTGYGRDDETPTEVVVELASEGYELRGTKRESKASDLFTKILTLLPDTSPGVDCQQILDNWSSDQKPRKQRVLDALSLGFTEGKWNRAGEGKKGSPYTFWKVQTEMFP